MKPSRAFVGWVVLGLGIAGAVACSQGPREPGKGVLVIGIDGLRADHLGCYGHDRPTTPTLDALAEEGFRFDQAFTAAPLVLPAHISLFTGVYPGVARRFLPREFEGLEERRWRIPPRVPHLAIEFLASRYATAAFLDDPLLDPVYGFGPGFQIYWIRPAQPLPRGQSRTRQQVDRFLSWLGGLDEGRSWFAYVHLTALEESWKRPDRSWEHFFDPRPQLSSVPPVANTDASFFAIPRSRWPGGARTIGEYEASYDGHLRRLDGEIERLLGYLRRTGRFDRTTIHVVGTFGLQFGEAGLFLRAGRFSVADLRVPWIVRPRLTEEVPGIQRGGVSERPVSLVDLPPTLLESEGLPVPRGMHGRSRAALIQGRDDGSGRDYVFASSGIQEGCAVIGERYVLEYLIPESLDDQELQRSWFGELVEGPPQPHQRFYDRLSTPFPPLDIPVRTPDAEALGRYRRVLTTWLSNLADTRRVLQPAALRENRVDAETLQRLVELGYVGKTP